MASEGEAQSGQLRQPRQDALGEFSLPLGRYELQYLIRRAYTIGGAPAAARGGQDQRHGHQTVRGRGG